MQKLHWIIYIDEESFFKVTEIKEVGIQFELNSTETKSWRVFKTWGRGGEDRTPVLSNYLFPEEN